MRIAVLIIAICLVMIIGLQSCTVMVGGNIGHNQDLAGGGAVGILIAFLFLLGAAFSIGLPTVSMILFMLAGLLGIAVGTSSQFKDMSIWGGAALILAVLSFFGKRELKKRRAAMNV